MFEFIEEGPGATAQKNPAADKKIFNDSGQVIYTMPEKYIVNKSTKKSSNKLLIILVIFVLLAVISVIGIFLYQELTKEQVANDQSAKTEIKNDNKQAKTESLTQPAANNTPTTNTLPTKNEATSPTPTTSSTTSTSNTTTNTVTQTPNSLISVDTDKDGLTDVEEKLYHTDIKKPDTDGDGYTDAHEIKNLYDPLKIEPSKIETSGLINIYSNPVFNYKLFYPSSWLAKSLDQTNREVMFTSETGEFMEVIVQDNPEKMSAVKWYMSQNPSTDQSKLQLVSYDGWEGVLSADNMSLYLTTKNVEPYLYVLTYNYGNKQQINFSTTLKMFISSFQFIPKTSK